MKQTYVDVDGRRVKITDRGDTVAASCFTDGKHCALQMRGDQVATFTAATIKEWPSGAQEALLRKAIKQYREG